MVTNMVFDYFNIIPKEYEISYDRWKNDEEFKKQSEVFRS